MWSMSLVICGRRLSYGGRHDALGRSDVRAETHYTIDRATGVLLRSESVTPMADGGVTRTTGWQLDTLGQAG